MITEDYVNFETAKLLKENGFDEKTYRCYNLCTEEHELSDMDDIAFNNWELGDDGVAAPTLQMAMKWLREAHNIDISVTPDRKAGYSVLIFKNKRLPFDTLGSYSIYEQACETAIKYCLEKLV